MNLHESVKRGEQYPTVGQLTNLLCDAGIDISTWGNGSAKTIEHLHKEICEGESEVSFNPDGSISRFVRVAWVDVLFVDKQDNVHLLIEDRQEYCDGRRRQRQLSTSLGEKFKPGEEPEQAAIRALSEELGVTSFRSLYFTGQERTTHTPDSYPGLESNYDTYSFAAMLDESSYNPDGYVEVQTDKINYYTWIILHSATQ